MEIISQREFSRRVGVSEATIRKAIDNGWIVEGRTTRASGTPALFWEKAKEEWDSSPAGIQAAGKAPTFKSKTPAPGSSPPASQQTQKFQAIDPEAASAKKKILEHKQNSSQIDMQRRALWLQKELGKLVDKDQVHNALFEFGKGLRENLLVVPDRYVDEVRNAPDRTTAHKILLDGILEALRQLSSPPDLTNAA